MKIKRNKDIYFKIVSGHVVLLEKNKKFIRELNKSATFLWKQLNKPKTLEKLTESLRKKYKITKSQAVKDVKEWVKNYLKKGFLEKAD